MELKVVAVSDLHGILPKIPECDLLLIGGDICRHHDVPNQFVWLRQEFKPWLESVPAKKIVGVAGNHDFIWEKAPHMVPPLPWTYLQDQRLEYEGWKIWGSPWQPRFYDWAFNLDEPELKRKWKFIPDDTDVLVLHGPPKHFGDKVNMVRDGEDGFVGSPSLTERIKEVRPKLAIFGHIHPGFGVYELEGSTLANVSVVNEKYELTNSPTEFILDRESKKTVARSGLLGGEMTETTINWHRHDQTV